jgi:hypothetical protein
MESFRIDGKYIHSDIVNHILGFLEFNKLIKIKKTCKLFNRIIESPLFWENKAKREFSDIFNEYNNITSKYVEVRYLKLELRWYQELKEILVDENANLIGWIDESLEKGDGEFDMHYYQNKIDNYNAEIRRLDKEIIKRVAFIEKIENPKTRYNLSLIPKTHYKIIGPREYFEILFNLGSYCLQDFKKLFKEHFNAKTLIKSFELFMLTSNNNEYICLYTYRGASGLKIAYSAIDQTNKNLPGVMYQIIARHGLTKRMIKDLYNIPFDFNMICKEIKYNKENELIYI